jgi:regulator of sirC expression with transglutaminase-like and TPR domain
MASEAARHLVAVAGPDTARIPLAEAALWIAAEEYPNLDVEAYVDRLDELAEVTRRAVFPCAAEDRAARFNDFLFGELGFAGNTESYDDPRNSFLNDVIDRRRGIPISLSLVYTEIGTRLGLPVVGVGFPGHFLVKWLAPAELLVDAFHGRVISRDECSERLRTSFGPNATLDERMLAPASPREILTRWLRNLKQNYLARGDFVRALAAVDRIVMIAPDEAAEIRDRGILYHRVECYAAALADFERYLKLAPNDLMAGEIRRRLPELRREAARLQ